MSSAAYMMQDDRFSFMNKHSADCCCICKVRIKAKHLLFIFISESIDSLRREGLIHKYIVAYISNHPSSLNDFIAVNKTISSSHI